MLRFICLAIFRIFHRTYGNTNSKIGIRTGAGAGLIFGTAGLIGKTKIDGPMSEFTGIACPGLFTTQFCPPSSVMIVPTGILGDTLDSVGAGLPPGHSVSTGTSSPGLRCLFSPL